MTASVPDMWKETSSRPELGDAGRPALDAAFVEIVPEQIDPVGAGDVVIVIAIDIGEGDTVGGFEQRTATQTLAYPPAVLVGHAIGLGELEIGQRFIEAGLERDGAGKPLPVLLRQGLKSQLALPRNLAGGAVGAEKLSRIKFIERDQAGNALGPAGMAGQRGMFGPRQLQPPTDLNQCGSRRRPAKPGHEVVEIERIH